MITQRTLARIDYKKKLHVSRGLLILGTNTHTHKNKFQNKKKDILTSFDPRNGFKYPSPQ